jgi:tRNA/tmRNA/rRNA uracil-C5-methylase (TrmA/RlmC/RlmD family)
MFQNSKLDRFWTKRYMLFEKFDYGVKLDEDSLFSVVPEAISSYLSQRIACQKILVGYCGVGGEAIKFSTTCHKVIAVESDETKL